MLIVAAIELFTKKVSFELRKIKIFSSLTLVPCVRHQIQDDGKCVYSYPTSVILSIFLGITGGDRFYLGHTASAIGKLFTLGGLGVWWIVDIVLLLTGQLMPKEGYSWCNNY